VGQAAGTQLVVTDPDVAEVVLPAQPRPRRHDYLFTFASEFGILLAGLIVLRVAAHYWSVADFGAFVLARRALTLAQLPLLCNMAVAVSRFTAMARASGDRGDDHFLAGIVIAMGSTVVGALLVIVAARLLAILVFGDARFADLVRAIALALPPLVLHGVLYGELRGRLAMRAANALQVANLGVAPLAVFALRDIAVVRVFQVLAAAWTFTTVPVLLMLLLRHERRTAWLPTRPVLIEMLRYGLPRVPGEFALAGLLSLPPIITAHVRGVTQAGFVGLGCSLLGMVGALFAPLGQIVLPSVSALAARGEAGMIRREVRRLGIGSAVLALPGSLALLAMLGPLIRFYMGAAYLPAVPAIRVILAGVVPYVLYIVLRNVLDALSPRPLNARNLLAGVTVSAGFSLLAATPTGVALGLVAGLFVVAAATLRDVRALLA
jgi:O-antigen/teichoic acid export membrane protein